MTALDRLRRTRASLLAIEGAASLLWGVAAALAALTLLALTDRVAGLDAPARSALRALPALAAISALAVAAWRARHALALPRVALWVEEHVPELRYALVTARELGEGADFTPAEPVRRRWRDAELRAAARALVGPIVATALAAALLALVPRGALGRVAVPRPGDALRHVPARADRLTPLVARITPPRYAGGRDSVIDEPTTLRALPGSTVRLLGRGAAAGIRVSALAGSGTVVTATAVGDTWQVALRAPARALALRVTDDSVGRSRTVVLEPIADAPPQVTLAQPARDSVLRAASGAIPLAAEARDDHGLARAAFEVIVSSGEGENFTFRTLALGERLATGRGARHVTLGATLDLASLALKPGDVLHLRAVARDANDVTGPGTGSSETRTLRIARAGEYDSVAVDAAPPAEAEKSALSQRMLIQLAEALEKRRRSLDRPTLLREATRISADQKRLRKAVGELVFMRLGGGGEGEHSHDEARPDSAMTPEELLRAAEEATAHGVEEATDFAGDETPVVAINRPLLEAYNAMWSASGELDQGATARALPHMYAALEALQRARAAERIYLRGRTPPVVVDLSRARLKGDRPASIGEAASTGEPDPRVVLAQRFERALALVASRASGAADSLALLRVDALGTVPAFAEALGDATEALRTGDGRRASAALTRARRALLPPPRAATSLPRWGGGW